MSSIRKCKACFRPVKGHPGAYGLSKCKNSPLDSEAGGDPNAIMSKTNEVEVVHGEEDNKDVFEQENVSKDDNLETEEIIGGDFSSHNKAGVKPDEERISSENLVANLVKQVIAVEQQGQMYVSPVKEYDNEEDEAPVRDIALKDVDTGMDDDASTDEYEEMYVNPVPSDALDGISDSEIPDCSLGEASLCFEVEGRGEEAERKRLASKSDTNVDIRNLIIGRGFVLCVCDNVRDCFSLFFSHGFNLSLTVNARLRSTFLATWRAELEWLKICTWILLPILGQIFSHS